MAVEVQGSPDDSLVDLEYALQVREQPPSEVTTILSTHYPTRTDAERVRQKAYDDGLVGVDIDIVCRRVSRWQVIPV
jgi:hypothetical protein